MPTYQALLHPFRVVCDDEVADAYLREVLAPLTAGNAVDDDGVTEYRLTRSPGSTVIDALLIDGEADSTSTNTSPVGRLLECIDQDAERVTGATHTVLHAAACHLDGRTLLVPGAPDAGKSTLMASLALRGWTYLSDELLAVLPGSPPRLLSYPRTVVLDPGSWPLFDGHFIEPPQALAAQLPRRRHLAPPVNGRLPPGITLPVSDVLLYRWSAGSPAHVGELDPVDGLRALLGSSFSLREHPQRDLDRLSEVVDHCTCWEAVGDGFAALEEVLRATLELPPS